MNSITSSQNAQFKYLKSLQQKKYRQRYQRFLLEGFRYVVDAIENGWQCEGVYVHEHIWETLEETMRESLLQRAEVTILSAVLFEAVAETLNSQGIIGVFLMRQSSLDTLEETDRFIVYLDRIQDPGNLGTIIRTADAAGVDAVVLNRGCVDVFNSKALRSTAGSILNVRLIYAESDDEVLTALSDRQFKILVTDLQSDFDFNDNLAYGEKNCLVIGNEGSGVSETIKAMANVRIKIPIYGKAESLNASVAAGILIYKIKTIL